MGLLNMDDRLLTVKEFAEIAGVSVQSVYKKMMKKDHPIQRFINPVEGVKYIRSSALDLLYQKPPAKADEKSEAPRPEPSDKQPQDSSMDRLLSILETQLEDQRRQLQEKDRIISKQAEHITALLQRLEDVTRAIDQQQQLTAISVKALTASPDPVPEPDTGSEPVQPMDAAAESTERRGFFRRIFGRR